MTRRAVKAADPRQLSLDDWYRVPEAPSPGPGSLDYATELCATLSEAMRATDQSRAVIAARMSDLTHEHITEAMLNAYTAKSHDRHRFPFEFAAAFEVACEATCLQSLLAGKRGSLVLVGKEALDAELGRIRRQQAELRRKEKTLETLMRKV